MTTLYFAQLSDLHLSVLGDHHDLLAGRAAEFLERAIIELSQAPRLDFVILTGDLLDTGSQAELEQFQRLIASLKKPYYVIPGNHDSSLDNPHGLSRYQFAAIFNPQLKAGSAREAEQFGYWSLPVGPDVHLIGLDSSRDEDWGGVISPGQVEWLKGELAALADKLVVLAVHHPFHPLAPIDSHPDWGNFVCSNGPELLALLDRHPQVKLVLTGHHHVTQADRLGSRLHLACPAMVGYPCAYRTLRLTREGVDDWQVDWVTHPVAAESTLAEARARMLNGWQSIGFAPNFVEEYVRLALGSDGDRQGSARL